MEDDPGKKLSRIRKKLLDDSGEVSLEAPPSVQISGNGNIVGNGNVVLLWQEKARAQERQKVVVRTGVGVITAQQKGGLKRLVKEIVETEAAVKKFPSSYGKVWGKLLSHVGKTLMGGTEPLNKYDEIPKEHYEESFMYLSMQLGNLRNMATAPKKAPAWRKTCLAAIWAEVRKYDGGEGRMRAYIEKRFSTGSLTELTDEQLSSLRTYIRGWRRVGKS